MWYIPNRGLNNEILTNSPCGEVHARKFLRLGGEGNWEGMGCAYLCGKSFEPANKITTNVKKAKYVYNMLRWHRERRNPVEFSQWGIHMLRNKLLGVISLSAPVHQTPNLARPSLKPLSAILFVCVFLLSSDQWRYFSQRSTASY